ncbi:MAG TPA: ABC transporter ATP-binding protein [Myxococcales bacterium]|nr:ABC transporter ATP-binding protein [Myxococcales bacterium]
MSAPAILARGLAKRFGEKRAVSGVDFEIATGEVFGLLGPNGAGKTTTLRMLAGMLAPDEGVASVVGFDVVRSSRDVRERVGLLTEQPGLYDRLTTRENLAFYAQIYGVSPAEGEARIQRLLELLGIWAVRDERAGTLSKGTRQKVAIARALVHDPQVIFLDEPTSGLDPEAARTVRDSISELASSGRTLVLCTHNLFEVERLCRRVAVMRPGASGEGGRIVASTEVAGLRKGRREVEVTVAGDAGAFTGLTSALPGVASVQAQGSKVILSLAEGESVEARTPEVVRALVNAGAQVRAVIPHEVALEDAYLSLVAEEGAA